MTNKNNLNESIDITQYITFLIGSKYLKCNSIDVDFYTKCQTITYDFMISKYFNISKEDFNIKEYIKEKVEKWEDQKNQ